MVVSVPATLPDSILAPPQVMAKFKSATLAGLHGLGGLGNLGYQVCDETGACVDYPDTSNPTDSTTLAYPLVIGPTTTGAPPGTVATDGGVNLCSLYPAMCQGGAPTAGGGGVTPSGSSTSDWSAILAQALKSGTDLSKLYLIQPGTSLSTAGAITRQNPGFAIPSGSPLNVGTGSLGSMLPILLIAGLAVMFMSRQGR